MPETSATPLLSDRQRRLTGFALGLLAVVATVALICLVFVALGRAVGYFASVLWPLAVAGVFALILRPVVDRFEQRLNGRRVIAVTILFVVFTLALAALLLTIVPPVVSQVLDFITYLPKFWNDAVEYVKGHYPSWVTVSERMMSYPAVSSMVDGLKTEAGKVPAMLMPSLKAVSEGITGTFGFVTHAAVIPIYLFFFLLGKRDPIKDMPSHLPFFAASTREDIVFLTREFVSIVTSFFRGQIVIGLIMGALLAIGFTIVGLKFGLFIGLMLGILNIIPYLGTIIGLIFTVPLAFFQPEGGLKLVVLVLVVYTVVQNVEGWFLTPKIMGDRTGLHPVAIIVAIFFWGTAFDGILGMILAIPLTAFFVTAWRFLKWRHFPLRKPVPLDESATPPA